MKLVIGINIQRYKEKPLFQVTVEDIDNPVNFHSYECLFFESCNTLEELEEVKNKAQLFINTLEVKEVVHINTSLSGIDDDLKKLGVDPDSKQAKMLKECYYRAIDRILEKGEEV